MATAIEEPSHEKEETGEGDMMFDVHPPLFHGLTSRKQNRENRIKSACLSNSHSNIAPSNDKRLLFVQIPATSSALLVSTLLPVQCLRPTNFFFFKRIFLNSFLRHQNLITQLAFRRRHEVHLPRTILFSCRAMFFHSRTFAAHLQHT